MATKLFLLQTQGNGPVATGYYDLTTSAGSSLDTGVVNTFAGTSSVNGTDQAQWTKTAGGQVIAWISGGAPSGGFTLSGTMTFNIWAKESNMSANIGGRARVYKRTLLGVETEILGGPWDDGVEFGTAIGVFNWTGAPTSTIFLEDDSIVVKYFITNVGTMGNGFTGTIDYDTAVGGSDGDSYFQINENVTFKAFPSGQPVSRRWGGTPHVFDSNPVKVGRTWFERARSGLLIPMNRGLVGVN